MSLDAADNQPRWPRWMLLMAMIPACWLGMMAVHELGHVATAWIFGTPVEKVVLHPLSFSRTDVGSSDHHLAIVWMGPVIGIALPMLLWLIVQLSAPAIAFLFRFFAGFCCIANGIYLSLGWIDRIGDAGDLMRMGMPIWSLIAFGASCVVLGLWLWHRLATSFGFGKGGRRITPQLAMWIAAIFGAMATMMALLFPDH